MARDDFSAKGKRILKARVNDRCSRPDCRAQTSAPASHGKVISVGTAAHICAASPLGPRYDRNQTPEERGGIGNAIWLCNNCAREIDLDVDKFTPQLLREWKRKAEEVTSTELGVRAIQKDSPVDTVAAALTGMPKKILYDSIANVHSATAKAWENLDPRFSVDTQYVDGVQIIGLQPKEPVSCSIVISPDAIEDFSRKANKLFNYGISLKVNSRDLLLSGSPIFDEIIPRGKGHFTIKQIGDAARTKILLIEKNGQGVEQVDDFVGEMTVGQTHYSFVGYAFGGLLCLEYSNLINFAGENSSFNFKLLLDSWDGKNVLSLPYFDHAYKFFKKIKEGWSVRVQLDSEHGTIFKGELNAFDDPDFVEWRLIYFHFIEMCRVLSDFLGVPIVFEKSFVFDDDTYNQLIKIVSIIKGERVLHNSKAFSGIKAVITLPVENKDSFVKNKIAIKYQTADCSHIDLFGVSFELPKSVITFENVTPKIIKTLKSSDKEESLDVEFIPADDFKFTESYELP